MIKNGSEPYMENHEDENLATTKAKVNFCMQRYRPFIRQNFNLHQLSVITNIPVPDLENYFNLIGNTFDQSVDEWRVQYAKSLMHKESAMHMEPKTIGSLSGFSTETKFVQTFKNIEGISPEIYQSQINKSK